MPRVARIKSKSGIYHIIMRGINRQTLFEDEEDCVKFIQTLQRYREICEYKLYAYCLMDNHLHILLMEGKEPLETVMRRICGSYVLWYKAHCKIDHAIDIQKFDVDKRNLYLKDLMDRYGLSIRQLERLTGISRGIIQRI